MKIRLKPIVCLLLVLVCLCSCGTRYNYDENGEFHVVNGQLPEELPKPSDLYLRAPMKEFASLSEYVGEYATDYIVFRAKKVVSESVATKDATLEYTLTKMGILDVYINEGETYKEYAVGETISIVENYTFVPDGNQITFKKVDIWWQNLDRDTRYRGISEARGYEYVQPDREYIVILMNDLSTKRVELVNSGSKQCIISEEQVSDILVPEMIQAIDGQRYAEMLTQEVYTMPAEERPGRIQMDVYDYFYFDILSQYVFNEK